MSRVTSIVVRPAPGTMVRAAAGTVEITVASASAHWIAGGMMPSIGWLLASALPIFGVGVLLQRGRVTLPCALAWAAAGQGFLHVALVAGTPGDHLHAGGSAPSMMVPMLVAHAVGALATVLVWSVRRRLWDVIVRVSKVRTQVLRAPAQSSIDNCAATNEWLVWMALRRRGPPGWVCV